MGSLQKISVGIPITFPLLVTTMIWKPKLFVTTLFSLDEALIVVLLPIYIAMCPRPLPTENTCFGIPVYGWLQPLTAILLSAHSAADGGRLNIYTEEGILKGGRFKSTARSLIKRLHLYFLRLTPFVGQPNRTYKVDALAISAAIARTVQAVWRRPSCTQYTNFAESCQCLAVVWHTYARVIHSPCRGENGHHIARRSHGMDCG